MKYGKKQMLALILATALCTTTVTQSLPVSVLAQEESATPQENMQTRSGESEPTTNSVASVEIGGVITYYDTLNEALNAANGHTATITVLQDTAITGTNDVDSGNITLDENNHNVTYSNGSGGIDIYGGTVTARNMNHNDDVMGLYTCGGTLIVESGYIHGIGIDPNKGGTITMNGGMVYSIVMHGGTLYFNGGEIQNIRNYGGTIIRKSPKPAISFDSVKAGSITVKPLENAGTYGGAKYKLTDESGTMVYDWQDSNVFENLSSDTAYKVYAKYAGTSGNDRYAESEEASMDVTTLKDGTTFAISEPTGLTATYGQTLSDVSLPTGWSWADNSTSVAVGTQSYTARYDVSEYEDEYDFTNVDGYNATGHYVERTLTVNVSKANSTLSITTQSLDKEYDGTAVKSPEYTKTGSTKDVTLTWYVKDGSDWKGLALAPTDAGSYKVVASVEADDNYNGASAELEFSISQVQNEWETDLSIAGWTYGENANTPSATAKYGTVKFTYSDKEDGTYTDTVPTNAGTWYVKATVAGTADYTGLEAVTDFEIEKAESKISFNEGISLGREYNGKAVGITTNDVTKTGSTNDVSFTWQQKNGDNWTDLSSAPVSVGSYRVIASVAEDRNFKGASATLEFTISQTTNEWTNELSIADWTYGQTASTPTATAKYGDVVFTYSDSEDGTFTTDVPTTAGTWYVKATVAGTADYTGLEAVTDFEIEKALPTYEVPTGLTIKQGEALSSLALPDGFTWTDEEQTADTLGSQTFTALFTPEDTGNYQTVKVDITVEVLPALTPLNQIPAISAEDKTLTVGNNFDPLSGVTATDTEDGDLTEKIEVIHNSVDTTQAGAYEVTYKVTDSNGASSTKTITITVKDKENTQGSNDTDTNKGNTDKTASSDDKQASVETGDSMNLVVWTALMLVSVLGAVLSILFRRRTQR